MSQLQKVIDVHTHILNQNFLDLYRHDFEKILCITQFEGFANNQFAGLEEGFEEFVAHNDRLYIIQCIDYQKEIAAQLDDIARRLSAGEKIRGVKFYVGYQHFYPTDPKLRPVYEFCGKHGLVAVFHSGCLLNFKNSKSLLKYSHPRYIDEIAVDFPGTKFEISHLGFPHILETFAIVSKNENVYTDISGTIDSPSVYAPYVEDVRRAVAYFPEVVPRLMFGTDFGPDESLREVDLYLKVVNEIFDGPDRQKVLYDNAKEFYRL